MVDKSSSFFRGNSSFHVSNIKGHDLSRRHTRCEEAPIFVGIRNLNEETLKKLEKLFNIAYYNYCKDWETVF